MSLCWVSSVDWFPLFYPGHELCGRRVRKVENSLKKLIMGGAMLSILIFLFPTVVWRRLRYDRVVAEWDEQCRMGHGDE